LDPNPEVNGAGVSQLRAAGVEVVTGVLEGECRQLIAPFLAMTVQRRPYVTLKWAESSDGFIAGVGGERRQISSAESTQVVHLLRARSDAVLVGGQTLRADDPLLTVRVAGAVAQRRLLRAVVSRSGEVPKSGRLFGSPEGGEVVVYVGRGLGEALVDLAQRGVANVLVESGGRLATAMLGENLVDRIWKIRSALSLGDGLRGISVPSEGWVQTAEERVGSDVVSEWLNARSPVFFRAGASIDAEQLLRR
jgi:diaminohydroxyphosphoribosylaminopyrimidine deaminase/5-amino-6-(5-phosphoribosylamino)uracil reductase